MKQKNGMKRYAAVLILILLLMMIETTGFAVGKLDTSKESMLHISYMTADGGIPNSAFDIYKVCDADEFGQMTVRSAFTGYPLDFTDMNAETWQDMALTLKGYVQRDNAMPTARVMTDENGDAFIDLSCGLYLVVGNPVICENDRKYFSDPFMVFLPDIDEEANEWIYELHAIPKNTSYTATCSVMKIWNDAGYESLRPEEISVDLLCNGAVFQTVVLNQANGWKYEWDSLAPDQEWVIAEHEIDSYTVNVSAEGRIYTVTNTYTVPVSENGITVKKRIIGDTPEKEETFRFTIAALDGDAPMPEVKTIAITGAGYSDFGEIIFTKPGIYRYKVTENKGNTDGWTYDSTEYIVSITVEEENSVLRKTKEIKADGSVRDDIEFTNEYHKPGEKLPQTGMTWWPVLLLVTAGLAMIVIGCIRNGEGSNEKN